MSNDTETQRTSAITKIESGTITAKELRELRKNLKQAPPAQPQQLQINRALNLFEERNQLTLLGDPETQGELAELRASLATLEAPAQPGSPFELPPAETPEPPRATTIIYERWKEMMDPNHSTQGRLLRAAGFVAAGYGIYRLATWVTGRPKNTRTWKFLKYTGLAALAAWTLGVLMHKKEGTNNTPEETEDKAYDRDPNTPASALDVFPQNKNLVDGPAHTVTVDGTSHRITFKKDEILLGDVPFGLTAMNTSIGNVRLALKKAVVRNGKLSVTAGAWGQSGETTWNEMELKELLGKMVRKETVVETASDGQKVEIKATK